MEVMSTKVPFLDLRVSLEERREILDAIDKVLQHGRFILGPEVTRLESSIAEYCGRKYAVGVGSGTDALFLGLKSLGIGAGDEVITTSLSWIATTNAIAMTGAEPVFADIGDDLNIDPLSVESLITNKTKAILPVNYTGKVANMDALNAIAKKYKIKMIEDAAQSFGATYNGGKAGSFGFVSCFSMNPMKVYAACGEAGMVLTDDDSLYQQLVYLRYNGTINKEVCIATSLNCRLDTIQAAVLLSRLNYVESIISRRREIAEAYSRELSPFVRVPRERPNERDIYYTYQIQTPKRNELKQFLEENGIEVKIQHPFLMCQQPLYKKYLKMPVLNAQRLVQEILCLPIHEKMTNDEVCRVIGSVKSFFS